MLGKEAKFDWMVKILVRTVDYGRIRAELTVCRMDHFQNGQQF